MAPFSAQPKQVYNLAVRESKTEKTHVGVAYGPSNGLLKMLDRGADLIERHVKRTRGSEGSGFVHSDEDPQRISARHRRDADATF